MSQAQATLTAEQQTLLNNLKSSIIVLLETEIEDAVSEFQRKHPHASDELIEAYEDASRSVAESAQTLLKFEARISFVGGWEKHTRGVVKRIASLRNGNFSDPDAEFDALDYLEMKLSAFIKNLSIRSFKIQKMPENAKKRASDALNHFVEIGREISSDPNYNGSNVEKLDCILEDMERELNNDLAPLRHDNILNCDDSFVAIAAPSMEGKTQAAFTFKHVKPIYLPLSEATSHERSLPQAIYTNFSSHVKELYACAKLDLERISPEIIDQSNFTATKLKTDLRTVELWTVGFLMGLVSSEVSNADWINHYVNMNAFHFAPVSIADVPVGFFNGYCIFLDEFSRNPWSVFVRNLARALGLRCICSNTNTRVANIVGKSSTSAEGEIKLWSLVAVRLNPPCEPLLDEKFGLGSSIQAIREAAAVDSALFKFLADFENYQLKYLRPGVAIFVAKAFGYFAESLRVGQSQASLGSLLDFVCFQLYNDLVSRKSTLMTSELAYYARVCLFYSHSYSVLTKIPERAFYNQQAFLENHLSYLKNPQDQSTWIFATVPPKDDSKNATIRTVKGKLKFKTWDDEYTFFEKEELLTNFGCMFVPFQKTPTALLTVAQRQISRSSASAASDAQNPNAIALPGNPLEVAVAVSIADASQHAFDFERMEHRIFGTDELSSSMVQRRSFAGQSGIDFIRNLVLNLNPSSDFDVSTSSSVQVEFRDAPGYNLADDFLAKCKIPFLYGIGHEIEKFKTWSAPGSDFYVGTYERTRNDEQIDGKFSFLFNNQEALAVTECKNLSSSLIAGKLLKILKKAVLKNDSIFNMIFCRLSSENPKIDSRLHKYCRNKHVNVYRAKKLDNGNYRIEPFFSGDKAVSSNPSRICIIFESLRIEHDKVPPQKSAVKNLKQKINSGFEKIKNVLKKNTSKSKPNEKSFASKLKNLFIETK